MPRAQREHPRLSEAFAEVALASGIGYLAASYAASRWLTKASPGSPRRTPADLGLACELAECSTTDGHRLKGWIVTPARPRASVVLLHGLHHNREQTLGRI